MSETTSPTTETTDAPVVEVTRTEKIKALAKKYLLPVTASVAAITALAVISHHKRIDELEDDYETLTEIEYAGDDEETVDLSGLLETEDNN